MNFALLNISKFYQNLDDLPSVWKPIFWLHRHGHAGFYINLIIRSVSFLQIDIIALFLYLAYQRRFPQDILTTLHFIEILSAVNA